MYRIYDIILPAELLQSYYYLSFVLMLPKKYAPASMSSGA